MALGIPLCAFAQQGLTFTVTPPLFQLNLQPGESWTSGIRVVNGNPYDITVYAEPVLFRPSGEEGRPLFYLPEGDASLAPDQTTLAGWITVPQTALTIPREQTITVPIAIIVPKDAAPGGHYAALLIGTRPPQTSLEDGTVSVTSSIASLIFLRIAGNVIEDARIREFSTEKLMYERPEAQLSLRFENMGNVHLRPQGDITIYNMFGKKRGYIPVNQATDYGNVLPGSVRKFTFTWEGDPGAWDIGRYRAEATLGYGEEAKQFAQATQYFYVLPLVPLLQVLGGLAAFITFIGWAIRSYIRRALALEAKRVQHARLDTPPEVPHEESGAEEPRLKLESLILPLQDGMVDLRRGQAPQQTLPSMERYRSTRAGFIAFLRAYRLFFLFLLVVAFAWLAASAFFADVLTVHRGYRATEERPDGTSVDLAPIDSSIID